MSDEWIDDIERKLGKVVEVAKEKFPVLQNGEPQLDGCSPMFMEAQVIDQNKTFSVRLGLDPVDHPAHYTFGTIEVITVIEDWGLGFHEANAVKYIARAKHKGKELEDLKKARWYLDRLIKKLES